jgi:hypothetical protein
MEILIEQSIKYIETRMSRYDRLEPLSRLALSKDLVIEEIFWSSAEIYGYKTPNEFRQILNNKEWFAPLCGKVLFFDNCYRLETCKTASPPAEVRHFIEEELRSVNQFLNTHYQFCQYYDSENDLMDRYLFTTQNVDPLPIDVEAVGLPSWLNQGCLLLAAVIANRQFAKLLKMELETLDKVPPAAADTTFDGTDTDIVEEMRGKYSSGSILVNDKPATKKQIMQMLEKTYNRKIPNWEQLDQSIGRRKKDRFAYHTRIMDALKRHQDRLDEKPSRR